MARGGEWCFDFLHAMDAFLARYSLYDQSEKFAHGLY